MTETTTDKLENAIDTATKAVAVEVGKLAQLATTTGSGEPMGFDNLLAVPVRVSVEVGRARLTLADVVKLQPGSLVSLDREAHEPVDILVNGKIVARGEVVTIDSKYGVRVSSVEKG